jgi:hypothetical protein
MRDDEYWSECIVASVSRESTAGVVRVAQRVARGYLSYMTAVMRHIRVITVRMLCE